MASWTSSSRKRQGWRRLSEGIWNNLTLENNIQNSIYGGIPTDWNICKLKDLCTKSGGIQTGPFGSQLHQKDYQNYGTPIITVEHLGENRILHSNLPYVSDNDRDRLSRFTLMSGDIVFSRVGSVDRRALVRHEENGWLFSGRCLRIRNDPNKIDAEYLSWFFGLPKFKEHIRQIAFGATMPSLNTSLLSNVEIIVPPRSEQKAISSILGTIDDMIYLDQQKNRTLERTAELLFKSWFVSFEFPNEHGKPYKSSGGNLADSVLGKIPRGWGIAKIGNIAEFRKGISYSGKEKFSKRINGSYVFITLNNILEGGGFKPEYSWIKSTRIKEHHTVKEGDLILANTEQTKVGRLLGYPALVIFPFDYDQIKGVFSHHITKVVPFLSSLKYYLYFFLKMTQQHTIAYHTGTTVWGFDVHGFKNNRNILSPPEYLIKKFHSVIESIVQMILLNCKQIFVLYQIRDRLIPKLISGEVRIKDTENVESILKR